MQMVKEIVSTHEGKFLKSYDIIQQDGSHYEMVSRKPIKDVADFVSDSYKKADAVSILAFNRDYTHVLLNYEWRVPVNEYIISFPAGLVDKGESLEQAAKRELWEETNCKITKIIDVLPAAYQSPGMSNEKVALVVCETKGNPSNRNQEAGEDITCGWCDRDKVKWLFEQGYHFSARAQIFLWCWINV